MVISDLPNDLESEILFRVPAKCLTKLRRTCKRWYALFRDPSFIKKNMDKATRELILHSNYDVHSISVNLHGVDPSMEFTGKLGRLNDPRKLNISRVFHCHGLVLCTTIGNAGLVVWNPSTGERKWIKPRTCYRCDDSYALGYVNNKSSCDIHSYKILRICRYYNDQEIRVAEFEMYEFSSDSWRVIDDDITWGIFSDGVSLKGNTYWVGGEKETGYFLINFDFTTERFSRLPLPYQSFHPDDIGVLSVVGEEKLSLVNQNLHLYTSPIKMNVWMTNKFHEAKDLSWSDFLVVDYDKLVLSSTHVDSLISFVLDEEKKVMLCSETAMFNQSRMGIYIIGEGIHKYVYKESTKGSDLNWPLLISYVPNLVRIQKNTPKITKKRKPKKAPIGGQLCKKC